MQNSRHNIRRYESRSRYDAHVQFLFFLFFCTLFYETDNFKNHIFNVIPSAVIWYTQKQQGQGLDERDAMEVLSLQAQVKSLTNSQRKDDAKKKEVQCLGLFPIPTLFTLQFANHNSLSWF